MPTGHWTPTSSHDIYMVDTPREGNGKETTEDAPKACSLEKQSKRQRKRRPKSCLGRNNDRMDPTIEQGEPSPDQGNTSDSAEDNPLQQDSVQEDEGASPHERAADREVEDDNYMPPSEDEASLDDDEFVVPEDLAEQERFNAGLWPRQAALRKNSSSLELTKTC